MAALFNVNPVKGGTEPCWDEWVSCEDGVDLPGKVCECLDIVVSVPTASLELLRTSEKLERNLEQLDLQAPLPSGKTNWDVIRDAHRLLKAVLTILEATLNEVSNKSELYRTDTNLRRCHAEHKADDNEDIHSYEKLCKSFKEVTSTASERCLQAIRLVANCIADFQEIGYCVPTLLRRTALDVLDTYGRINRAKAVLVSKKIISFGSTKRNSEREEKVFDCVWRLIEVVGDYVVLIQNQVLQSALTQLHQTEIHKDIAANLEGRVQVSWTWLKKLSKQVVVLCPRRKKDVFVYLLETFIQAAEELCHCQQLLSISVKGKGKSLVASAASSFQRLLLQCLAELFCNAEEVGSELKRTGLISDCEFPQISVAADNIREVLTLLASTLLEQNGTTISESYHLREAAVKSGNRLVPLTKEYLEIVLSIVHKKTPENEGIADRLKKLCCGLNNVYDKLKSKLPLKVDSDSTGDHREPANADQEVPDPRSLRSANDKEQTEPALILRGEHSEKQSKPRAFANPSSYPAVEVPDNTPAPETGARSTRLTQGTLKEEGFPAEGADSSLDRILLSMPSPYCCGGINIKELTEVMHLGSGNSGAVTLMKYNNSNVAVKEPVCPDPDRARQRMERECTVHQTINCHANIVRFLGRVIKTDEFDTDLIAGIITEYCQLGDLRSAIKDAAWIQELGLDGQDISFMSDRIGYQLYKNWVKRLEIISEVAAGMGYMHSHNIVHRDLTCKHVLFDSIGANGDFGVKICDFERAYHLPGGQPIQRTKAPANSAPWMGPEVLNHEKYGLKADVYSIGTLLWQLIYLENPWTHLKQRVGAGSTVIQHLLSTGRISLSISEADAPDDVPGFPELVQLVKRAWERDPDSRPTMAEFNQEIREICTRMKERVFQQT